MEKDNLDILVKTLLLDRLFYELRLSSAFDNILYPSEFSTTKMDLEYNIGTQADGWADLQSNGMIIEGIRQVQGSERRRYFELEIS